MKTHECVLTQPPRCERCRNEELTHLRAQLAEREETNRQITTALVQAEAQVTQMQKENETLYKDRNEAFKLWDDHKAENAALQAHANRLQKSYVESLNSANEQFASAKAALESKLDCALAALQDVYDGHDKSNFGWGAWIVKANAALTCQPGPDTTPLPPGKVRYVPPNKEEYIQATGGPQHLREAKGAAWDAALEWQAAQTEKEKNSGLRD
jgi:hypothetical protein